MKKSFRVATVFTGAAACAAAFAPAGFFPSYSVSSIDYEISYVHLSGHTGRPYYSCPASVYGG